MSCILDQLRPISAATLCRSLKVRRSTNALVSRPLSRSACTALRNATRAEQRITCLTCTNLRRRSVFLRCPEIRPAAKKPRSHSSAHTCDRVPKMSGQCLEGVIQAVAAQHTQAAHRPAAHAARGPRDAPHLGFVAPPSAPP